MDQIQEESPPDIDPQQAVANESEQIMEGSVVNLLCQVVVGELAQIKEVDIYENLKDGGDYGVEVMVSGSCYQAGWVAANSDRTPRSL